MLLKVFDVGIKDSFTMMEFPSSYQGDNEVRVYVCKVSEFSVAIVHLLPPTNGILFNLNGSPNLVSWSKVWLDSLLTKHEKEFKKYLKAQNISTKGGFNIVSPGNWGYYFFCDIQKLDLALNIS